MVAFFSAQLDFIFFFYGLAFIMLGWVGLAIARGVKQQSHWRFMASFGFLHGGGEWLDLLALIFGDSTAFTALRLLVMIVSFAALTEFARRDAIQLGFKIPAYCIYPALLAIVLAGGYYGGLPGANALARYSFGLIGSAGTAFVLACHARVASKLKRRWISAAVAGFALYAFATGIVVPEADFLHPDMLDHEVFARWTGTPIQLVRGLLACCISFAIWGAWGQWLIEDVGSPRYAAFMRRQVVRALTAMAAILVCGWLLTEYLGDIYKQNVEVAALGDLDLLASRLAAETAPVESVVRVIATAPPVRGLLAGDRSQAEAAVNVLNRDVGIIGASRGAVLDRQGNVVLAVGGDEAASARDYADAPYVRAALAGQAGFHFAIDVASKRRSYIASFPVRVQGGTIVGVAVLMKTIDAIEADLRRFDRSFFIVDGDGVVVMTNRPETLYQTLWPAPAAMLPTLKRQYGMLDLHPILKAEIVNAAWVAFAGSRTYVQRRPLIHGDWSLVTMRTPHGMFANRILGIIVTLQMAILAIVYMVGRERWIHDNVQLEKRLQLEELARNLDLRATTDPLTGLYNRRKFNRELASEILRAQRYQTPLSVILFDIDHFKNINDTHGHPAGDAVLTQLSRFVSDHIRVHDVLARWGGEEFIILAPGCDGATAAALAEKLRNGIRSFGFAGIGSITCSFGVAELGPEDSAEKLIARADEALYDAKHHGRDRIEFAAVSTMAPDLAVP